MPVWITLRGLLDDGGATSPKEVDDLLEAAYKWWNSIGSKLATL